MAQGGGFGTVLSWHGACSILAVRLNVCTSLPRLVVALVSCVLTSMGGRAWAQSELPGIRIDVPDDCAPPGELKRALGELLGEDMTVVRPVTLQSTGPDARAQYLLRLRLPNDGASCEMLRVARCFAAQPVMIASAIVPATGVARALRPAESRSIRPPKARPWRLVAARAARVGLSSSWCQGSLPSSSCSWAVTAPRGCCSVCLRRPRNRRGRRRARGLDRRRRRSWQVSIAWRRSSI